MRRADRLFQIIQVLRGATRAPITAQQLAEELETSARTIYRDIADLMAQRVPIRGEAGVGYVLESGYDMPPLMLTADEIEAALLGAQWVATQGDPALAAGARDLIAKISDVVPEDLRPTVLNTVSMMPPVPEQQADAIDMQQLRSWIRRRGKIRINYRDVKDDTSERTIWPIAVAYFHTVRLIVAWCESRENFRHFRTDRIKSTEFLEDTYPTRTEVLRKQWWEQEIANHKA
ncbi:MAG: YafY family transcriptional regulator [Alphaproteobacteria bacterium]|jgi:predicted DNA-binding transcriptional regulator YafY|nr:YafY family transcriptional regulator [Alphaproteobacteria bacterium]MBT4086474.1 YafY family transcriptional regulator [Alphaproteobacteria bacterium]MBT4546454.1 YafY family transcriptional regulator [Alphaproteobacteria bacterium]MBT7745455.1 YafY family transcriptional regulator [Alphaproteobacteria bacterium]